MMMGQGLVSSHTGMDGFPITLPSPRASDFQLQFIFGGQFQNTFHHPFKSTEDFIKV